MGKSELNSLIADFMGLRKCIKAEIAHCYRIKDMAYAPSMMKYHTSWEWLMPVVEKIEYLGFDCLIGLNTCTIIKNGRSYNEFESTHIVNETSRISKIQGTCIDIGKFIEWHNARV